MLWFPSVPFAPSAVTTRVSALVAPFLRTGTGYVRPEFRAQLNLDRSRILAVAARYNDQHATQLSDRQFAAVMLTILYNEHNGWLEDMFPVIRGVTPLYQDAQAVSNAYLGTNFSVWPSNLRPSVVREIYAHEVPTVGIVPLPLPDLPATAQVAANDPDTAYELLGANLRRGIIRAQHEHVRVTWQTLLAWHNAGVVAPSAIRANPALLHYVTRARAYLPEAQNAFLAVAMCPATTPMPPDSAAHPQQLHAEDQDIDS